MSFNQNLGLQLADDGSVVLDTRPEHEVAAGIVHVAVLTTLAEVAAARAVGGAVLPSSLTINLLERAQPGRLVARGRLLRKGRRLATAEGEVTASGKLVAKAVVTFAIME